MESHSKTTRRRFLGRSSIEMWEKHEIVHPAKIITEYFTSTGHGNLILEAVTMKASQMSVTKNLTERAAYAKSSTKVIQKKSRLCAPKIDGDPIFRLFKGGPKNATFGDLALTAINMVNTGA
jgi:hypothetical protein